MSQNTPHAGPATQIRLGAIKAAVWRNERENGAYYSVTFSRLYRDGDRWQQTESFGRDDLLLLAKVADHAHSWILAQGRDSAAAPAVAGTDEHPAEHTPASPGRPASAPRPAVTAGRPGR